MRRCKMYVDTVYIDTKFDAEFGKGWWACAHSYDRRGALFVLIPN